METTPLPLAPTRRQFLALSGAALALPALPAFAAEAPPRVLTAGPAGAPLFGPPRRPLDAWGYDGAVPGPTLRHRQGERLRVLVRNALPQPTTVHWHGLRLPNAMDGVPHLTQPPIEPGGEFLYDFALPDAGTYWYHPHLGSAEQLDRGLSGVLIVDEAEPPEVDRDVVWVIDDWRIAGAALAEDFGNLHDATHGGRMGNLVTVNGRAGETLAGRAGERVRLRLVNVANARLFRPRFAGHSPQVVALDGQPVAPHSADGLVLGPGMRADLILDLTAEPGSRHAVTDDFYQRAPSELGVIAYASEAPLRASPAALPKLAPNPLAAPDLDAAEALEIKVEGGAMGSLREGVVDGETMGLREMVQRHGMAWTVNGTAFKGHHLEPLFTMNHGRSYRIAFVNDTRWPHPMHLHGHHFQVLTAPHRPWRDTVLLMPGERAEVALVADNPGDWMLHCHVLEHQESGMMAVLRVA